MTPEERIQALKLAQRVVSLVALVLFIVHGADGGHVWKAFDLMDLLGAGGFVGLAIDALRGKR